MSLLIGSGSSSRPCCRPNDLPPVGRVGTTAPSLMEFSGSWLRACPGATSPTGMARGRPCTAGSAAGAWSGCGTACSPPSKLKPTQRAAWTGPSTLSMPRSCAPTSTRPGPRGGPGDGGARPQPGRVLDEGPSPRRGGRQAADRAADARPAAREHGVRAAAGAGRRRRPGRGRPRVRPDRIVGDKAYTGRRTRGYGRQRGIRSTIPRRRTERRRGTFDCVAYRLRNRVERLINRCKPFRSLATRYDKRGDSYRTLWVLAATIRGFNLSLCIQTLASWLDATISPASPAAEAPRIGHAQGRASP